MFLTKKEAQEHLKINYYHYSEKANTYAMTAWRSPVVERLLEILESFDWDSISIYLQEIELENTRKELENTRCEFGMCTRCAKMITYDNIFKMCKQHAKIYEKESKS